MGVTGPLAARITGFLALIALLCQVAPSFAAPRRVAIVNGAADQKAGAKGAAELRRLVGQLEPLTPLPSGNLSRALEDSLPDKTEIERGLDAATEALERAERHLASFNLGLALSELSRVEGQLAAMAYDRRVLATLATINVRRGLVYMSMPDRAAALEAFRLTRLLDPARRSLDAAAFDPVVSKAFADAGAERPVDARLEITTAYDGASVYVDGVLAERQPVEVAAGWHVVTATFPEHRSAGAMVEVKSGQTRAMRLDLWPQSSIERATALRRQLADTRDDAAYRAAAQAVAALTASDAVLIVRGATPGELDVAVFDQRDNTVSKWMALQGARPKVLLADILPSVEIVPVGPGPIEFPPPPPPPAPWYKQPRWQAVMGGSAAVTVAGILLFALSGDDGPSTTGGSLSNNPFD